MPTPQHRTCGPERPRGPVTNFPALPPRARATGKRFGSAVFAHAHARVLFLAGHFRARNTHARARTHAHARTIDDERRDVRSADRRRVADWITHCTTGEYGAYAHRLGAPLSLLLAAPIATPLQGGRPERPGLLFLKLPPMCVLSSRCGVGGV